MTDSIMNRYEVAELKLVASNKAVTRLVATVEYERERLDEARHDINRYIDQRDKARAECADLRKRRTTAYIIAAVGWAAALYVLAMETMQ